MATERLYHADSHKTSCTARVCACEPAGDDRFHVLLDRTVLFPAGGGQPCDLGTIGEANALECRETGGEVVHIVDRPLPVGAEVAVRLDWPRRFDFMQQHTGEHLLSFAAYKLFGARNVGFHLAAEAYSTIDFDLPLTREQLESIEALANEYIWRNLPVNTALYESEDALVGLPLRKHAEGLTAPIRIVSIEDADCCTCCAPHCAHTGEVGLAFLSDVAAYKGGTRVTFVCGGRAVQKLRGVYDDMDAIARRFSTAREKASAAVAKQCDELSSARAHERELARALNVYTVAELRESAVRTGKRTLMTRLFDGVSAGRLKELSQAALTDNALCALFSVYEGKLLYVLAESEGFLPDVSELIAAVNAATGGKGGGRGTFAQGTAPSASSARETVEQVAHYLAQRLK